MPMMPPPMGAGGNPQVSERPESAGLIGGDTQPWATSDSPGVGDPEGQDTPAGQSVQWPAGMPAGATPAGSPPPQRPVDPRGENRRATDPELPTEASDPPATDDDKDRVPGLLPVPLLGGFGRNRKDKKAQQPDDETAEQVMAPATTETGAEPSTDSAESPEPPTPPTPPPFVDPTGFSTPADGPPLPLPDPAAPFVAPLEFSAEQPFAPVEPLTPVVAPSSSEEPSDREAEPADEPSAAEADADRGDDGYWTEEQEEPGVARVALVRPRGGEDTSAWNAPFLGFGATTATTQAPVATHEPERPRARRDLGTSLLDNLSENEILTCGGPNELPPELRPQVEDEEEEEEETTRHAADLLSVDTNAWTKAKPTTDGVLE
jgi:hypothetical protein